MSSNFLLLGCLLLQLIALVIAIRAARSKRDLRSRLDSMVMSGGQVAAPRREAVVSIRRREDARSKHEALARFLKVPTDLPLANVVSPTIIYTIGFVLGCIVFWFGRYAINPLLALIVGVASAAYIARNIFVWEVDRYQSKLLAQLPDTIQLVVSSTRAGLPISEAFRAIGQEMPSPTRDEFIRVCNEIALGSAPDEALLAVHERTGLTEYAIFAVTIGVQARSGGQLAETVQNLADTIRERLALAARARALASESTMSAYIMAALPVICSAYMFILKPEELMLLFTDPTGQEMAVGGTVSLIFGFFIMRRLIASVSKD